MTISFYLVTYQTCNLYMTYLATAHHIASSLTFQTAVNLKLEPPLPWIYGVGTNEPGSQTDLGRN